MSEQQVQRLLTDYALGTLDSSTQSAVEQHLRGNLRLRAEADALIEGVRALALSTPDVALPLDVRRQLLARIRSERAALRSFTSQPPQPYPLPAQQAHLPANGSSRRRPRRAAPERPARLSSGLFNWFSTQRLWNALAVAAMLALVVLAFSEAQTNRQLRQTLAALEQNQAALAEMEIEIAQSQAENDALRSQIGALATLQEQERNRLDIVGSANRTAILLGNENAPTLQGAFYANSGTGALVVHNLQPLEEEFTYQIWLVPSEGEQISLGFIDVRPEQEPTWVEFSLAEELPDFERIGISVEPAGGSPQPTGSMLLES